MGRLPTFDLIRRHGMLGPSRCVFCNRVEETMDHVLCSCVFVSSVWHDFFNWFNISWPSIEDVGSLIIFAMNFEAGTQVRNLWRVGVVSLLWCFWTHRNDIIYNEATPSRISLLKQVKTFFLEAAANYNLGAMNNTVSDLLVLHNLAITGNPRPPPAYISVSWCLPPPDWIKINTDGSVRNSGAIHAGGVMRNAFNEVVGCFHFAAGNGAALEAELLAIIIAMESAFRMGWARVWFESDSSFVVRLLHSRVLSVPWRFKARWQQALSFASSFTWKISHIYREGNRAADYMASTVMAEGFWMHAVEGLQSLVDEDIYRTYTRIV